MLMIQIHFLGVANAAVCKLGIACGPQLKRGQEKSLLAEGFGWMSQEHEMYCHNLEDIGSKVSQVKPGVSTIPVGLVLISKFYT